MKKSLVLAMAMALGISATAFAANPFSDLPAGHWAYASVAKLAAAGIVNGYPDGTFKGDNLMTRYEMAQIVAKAYAKGGINDNDKLMAEFADELDNLGVRVAKLEKKSDNVKITGEFRAGYKSYDLDSSKKAEARTRLFLNGAVNDNWSYGAMIENTQTIDTNSEESLTKFRRAFVTGDLGSGVKVVAGRQAFKIGQGYVADSTGDAVRFDFGKVLKGTAFYGRLDSDVQATSAAATYYDSGYLKSSAYELNTDVYGLGLSYDFNKDLFMRAAYYNVSGDSAAYTKYADVTGAPTAATASVTERDIYTAGLGYKFDKNTSIYGEYLKASDPLAKMTEDDGYAVTLAYKGAKAAKSGSWGMYASYYDQAGATIIDHTSEFAGDWKNFAGAGIEGYEVGADYALAKNVIAAVTYYDFDPAEGTVAGNQGIWSRLYFTF